MGRWFGWWFRQSSAYTYEWAVLSATVSWQPILNRINCQICYWPDQTASLPTTPRKLNFFDLSKIKRLLIGCIRLWREKEEGHHHKESASPLFTCIQPFFPWCPFHCSLPRHSQEEHQTNSPLPSQASVCWRLATGLLALYGDCLGSLSFVWLWKFSLSYLWYLSSVATRLTFWLQM